MVKRARAPGVRRRPRIFFHVRLSPSAAVQRRALSKLVLHALGLASAFIRARYHWTDTLCITIYFLFNKNQPVTELIQQPVPVNTDSIKIDSIAKLATDSLAKLNAATVIKTDSSNFKIVIKDYNKEDAINKAFAKLSLYGHKLQIIKIDSANYKLVMPFYTSIADTLRAKDSLKKFFGGNPYLLKQ